MEFLVIQQKDFDHAEFASIILDKCSNEDKENTSQNGQHYSGTENIEMIKQ